MQLNTTTPESETGAGQAEPVANTAFIEVPLEQIIVEQQIRSEVHMEEQSFRALMASIEQKGVLEPLLIMPYQGLYRLVAGERRLAACQKLGLATVPVRVLENIGGEADVLSIQLIENLLRQDLDPIDQANACLLFFQARQPGITLDELITALTTFEMTPMEGSYEFTENISVIGNYTGKSNRSIINGLTLLRLPEEVQDGLKTGAIGPSIGYVFAANLDCPRFTEVYQSFLKNPLTVRALVSRFKQYRDAAQAGQTTQAAAKKPFKSLSASMKSTRAVIEKNAAAYAKADLEGLLTEVEQLRAFLKEKLLIAS